jgi:hypothetical protein
VSVAACLTLPGASLEACCARSLCCRSCCSGSCHLCQQKLCFCSSCVSYVVLLWLTLSADCHGSIAFFKEESVLHISVITIVYIIYILLSHF